MGESLGERRYCWRRDGIHVGQTTILDIATGTFRARHLTAEATTSRVLATLHDIGRANVGLMTRRAAEGSKGGTAATPRGDAGGSLGACGAISKNRPYSRTEALSEKNL